MHVVHPRCCGLDSPKKSVVACVLLTQEEGTYAQFHRSARRRGKDKAVGAVAHSVLVIVYYILRDRRPYSDRGADYFDTRDAARLARHHVRRLEQLGYTVTLTPHQAT